MSIYWEWNLGSLEAACPLNHESFQPTPQHTFQMTDVTWLMHRSVGFRSFYLYAVKVMATSFSRKKLLLFEIASEARKGRAGGEAGICPPPEQEAGPVPHHGSKSVGSLCSARRSPSTSLRFCRLPSSSSATATLTTWGTSLLWETSCLFV